MVQGGKRGRTFCKRKRHFSHSRANEVFSGQGCIVVALSLHFLLYKCIVCELFCIVCICGVVGYGYAYTSFTFLDYASHGRR